MDHIGTPSAGEGCTPRGADSICNGADDDGSGTVAVIELAEAFASARERPKRSLVFMTVSGEERGLWGSAYFADHPTVPLADVIADLNIDMVGRNSKDTVAVIGREHSNLGVTLDSVAAAHRELNIKPVGDLWPQEGLFFRSDHYNFAKKGVPILFFTTGLHPDYHQVTDSPEKISAEKETRFARLVFYLGQAVANTSQRPRWNPDSYKRIVGGSWRLADGGEQLGVRLGAPQLRQQHIDRLLRREPDQAPPELLFGGHRRRVGEQLFAPRAARGHIDGGVEASVRQRARQSQLRVAGPLELLEDHVVHPALRLDERRGDHREGAALGHGARRPEQPLGLGQRVGVQPTRHGAPAPPPRRVVRARQPRERVEHDHDVLAELHLAARVLEDHVGHRDVPQG